MDQKWNYDLTFLFPRDDPTQYNEEKLRKELKSIDFGKPSESFPELRKTKLEEEIIRAIFKSVEMIFADFNFKLMPF